MPAPTLYEKKIWAAASIQTCKHEQSEFAWSWICLKTSWRAYLRVSELWNFRQKIIKHSFHSPRKSKSTDQKDEQHHIGQGRSEIHHLERLTLFSVLKVQIFILKIFQVPFQLSWPLSRYKSSRWPTWPLDTKERPIAHSQFPQCLLK